MPVERVFLGTDKPPVILAAQWLFEHGTDNPGDLSQLVVGVPGSRGGERLKMLLAERASDAGVPLRPPDTPSAEALANRLLPVGQPIVPQPLRLLAWIEAFKAVPASMLGAIAPQPPDEEDVIGWAALGEQVESLATELGGAGLRFADVPAKAACLTDFADERRWQALAAVYEAYLEVLGRWHHADPVEARLVAMETGLRGIGRRVVLLALADLSPLLASMLERSGDAVTVLIAADAQEAGRFDDWGRPKPDAWADVNLPVPDQAIRAVEDPADQADAVLDVLAGFDGAWRADQIVIGLADAELRPVLDQHLALAGVKVQDAQSRSLDRTGAGRLLQVVSAVLAEERFDQLPALLRHPDIESWLAVALGEGHDHAALMGAIDDFAAERLPHRWDQRTPWPQDVEPSMAILDAWLEPLRGADRTPDAWIEPVLRMLAGVYGGRELAVENEADAQTIAVLAAVRDAASSWASATDGHPMSGAAATALLVKAIAGRSAETTVEADSVEACRWIELMLDDAEAAVVVGFNEGAVPRTHGRDAFLPERLRTVLGLPDSATRYAQDAHSLTSLLATRAAVALIAGRRGVDREPRMPSRLLMADDPDRVAQRVLRLFPDRPVATPRRIDQRLSPGDAPVFADATRWPPPPPDGTTCPEPIPVTAFRDYLSCPYRFCLKHALRAYPIEEPVAEMDGGAFGNLAHDVLKRFAQGGPADSSDVDDIADFLRRDLDRVFYGRYGDHPAPALLVQLEQMRQRLATLAKWQGQWAAAGWRIVHQEPNIERAEVPGLDPPLVIKGRIDRIDYNERLKRWAILDYKTGDGALTPEGAHQRSGSWIDLQLPLYRHLAAAQGLVGPEPVDLGYVIIGADRDLIGAHIAEWTDTDLVEADAQANVVGERIRAADFYPPGEPPRFDPYAAICGAEQFMEIGPVDLAVGEDEA